ncbi:hypothetical protein T440DRAFT_92518 [Plenodomus tracheiphilus IPT5]|uniref:Uncharacterized protein n=1 Tax=Plenodomus tracheiphilus IPT5 TaxID=1408161 RepID=A0A6A7ALT5_9PLEO|nr:hypothetical protein T440DRAFT_92518 [Plenodomus tracheiphilus IPT5]
MQSPDEKAEALHAMKSPVRKLVIESMPIGKQEETIACLKNWQECLEEIAATYVMVEDSLPPWYPDTMNTCSACEKPYLLWETVVTKCCRIHSFCDYCNIGNSYCLQCG